METRIIKKKDKPSTSKKGNPLPDGLNAQDEKRFDEFLDEKAEKYNVSRRLGKQIVKNIIASEESGKLLKVAIGLADPSELPEQKLTRSKSKVTVPLKPVDIPKLGGRAPNFLYVTDFGNEEEDTDFVVDEQEEIESSSSGEGSEEELEEEEDEREIEQELEELAKSSGNLIERDIWVNPLSKDINLNSVAEDHLADTNRELLIQLLERNWNEADEDFFEENDPDYNYEEEEKEEEPDIYEGFTHKLAVPKRECQLLLEEAYYDKVDINEEKKKLKEESNNGRRRRRNQRAVKSALMPSDGSCSILKPGPYTFKQEELDQLSMQLEQHVQQLVQMFVLCAHDTSKQDVTDGCLAMFNELNNYDVDAQQQKKKSFFNVSNLCAGINTIHDTLNIQRVPDKMIKWRNALAPCGYYPRPEACLAMLQSQALLYPELVPIVQPFKNKKIEARWSQVEETLLLLGLIQFGYIPNSSQTFGDGRYYQINKNLLPTRTPAQICNHLAAYRKAERPNQLQELILKAEDENPRVVIEFVKMEKYPMAMSLWPEEKRPSWYQPFHELFYWAANVIYSRTAPAPVCNTVVLPNTVTLLIKGEDGNLQPLQDGIILVNTPQSNGEMSTLQLQMTTAAGTVASTSTAIVPPNPLPAPPQEVPLTIADSNKEPSPPEPEDFVDIEAISSPEEEVNQVQEVSAPTKQEEPAPTMIQKNPQPNQPKPPTTVNKRKQKTPVKITVPVKKRKPMRKAEEKRPEEREEQLATLREDLAMSDDSESILSPQKIAHLREKRSYLHSVLPGPSSAPSVEQFQFQDMSRDMPILQPLEIQVPKERKKQEKYIPMTPRCRTPSDRSSSPEEIEEVDSPRGSLSELFVPKTPRDDNYTQSPTLLRMDPAMAQAVLSRVQINSGKRQLFPTDFSHLDSSAEEIKETAQSYIHVPYGVLPCSSYSTLPGAGPLDFPRRPPPIISLQEEPGKKWRKRTRQEKMNDGVEGMRDPVYRQRQEQLLCRHIHSDIKKRLTLRRDLYNKVKEVFKMWGNDPKMILQETYSILQPGYPEVFGLIACLFPDTALPQPAEGDKFRKAYRESLDMIMAIDAYTQRAKYKNNKNSKGLFRLMMSFRSEELSAQEFGNKMSDLFSDAPPLWNIIKTKLPVTCEDRVPEVQAEFIDLSLPQSACLSLEEPSPQQEVDKFQEALSNASAEVVDLSRVMGPIPPKQRNKVHVHSGHFYVNNGTNYMLAEVKRLEATGEENDKSRPITVIQTSPVELSKKMEKTPKSENTAKRKASPRKKSSSPSWTKEHDLKIINAYNTVEDGGDEAVIDSLTSSLPFPKEQIAQRLNFLLSLF